MARSSEFWDKFRRIFNPQETLAGPRGDAFYCDREHSPFKHMLLDFRRTDLVITPPTSFFTGHRGSGKSSMLLRLLEHFKNDYFVIYFDIQHNLDIQQTNLIDLLYLIGMTIHQVAVKEG